MSGISTGVGLISGIDTANLIDQLMAIESRPVTVLQNRKETIDTQRVAWMSLSAGLLGLKLSVNKFDETDTFQASKVTSSNADVITATADAGANLGTYQFTVRRLVQNHQIVSNGFADSDSTPIGAGTISIELAHGDLDLATELDFLNGQEGVRRGTVRITDRSGASADVDLTDTVTVSDVLNAINYESTIGVQARVVGDGIVLSDTTGLSGTIAVSDIGMGQTAADLGIAGSATDADLVGADVNYVTTSTSLDLLNDGNGIERTKLPTDLAITLGDSTVLNVNLYGTQTTAETTVDHTAHTLGDVIDAINNATGNDGKLVASISDDGNGLKLIDSSGGGSLVVVNGEDSHAATQLGIAGTFASGTANGESLIAGLNSVLIGNLVGGQGVTLGTLNLQDRSGATASVDLSSARSVSNIIEGINNAGLGISAALNEAGNGITITDTTDATAANLVVADGSGNLAASLGIAIDDAVTEVAGDNAQHKYISTQTRLSELNNGQGLTRGKFTITNSAGISSTIDLTGTHLVRLGDVVSLINSRGISVTAAINDSGTGLILTDSAGGAQQLAVTASGSSATARQLGLLGEAAEETNYIDGSMRYTIDVEDTDTLEDVVDKINQAGAGVSAGVINDGSSTNPYRLILTSDVSGSDGRIVIDTGEIDLDLTTFVEARDAMVYLGSANGLNSLVLTSGTNQLTGVLDGVTMDLVGVSEEPVSITVSRDIDAVVSSMQTFLESFNAVTANIDTYTQFDAETQQRGVLFGDGMVSMVRSRLMNLVFGAANVTSSYTRLSQVGFTLDSANNLSFDPEKFREAFAADRDGVIQLFTEKTVETDEDGEETVTSAGVGYLFDTSLEQMTDSYDGLISRVTSGLDSQTKLIDNRIESLNELLSNKRVRLERQFLSMEMALSQLQGQQNALSSLSQLASSFSASRN